MPISVVFLDIDGVLNSNRELLELDKNEPSREDVEFSKYFHANYCKLSAVESILLDIRSLSPTCMGHLNRLIKDSNSVVVVTSTWRYGYSILGLQKLLEYRGFNGNVVDITPVTFSGSEKPRGLEIHEWLEAHSEVNRFVILDDDTDLSPHLNHFVHVNKKLGLTDLDVERANEILSQ